MAGLGGIAGNAVNAVKGTSTGGTSLQTFLDKFSNTAGRYVDTIDPLGLFEVRFVFQPGKKPSSNEGFDWSRVGNSLLNSAKTAGMNMLDSATGGLASSLINDFGGKSIDEQRTEFMKKSGGKRSFLEYLVPANMLTSGEQWESPPVSPLMLDLSHYVQKVTGIQMQMVGEDKTVSSIFGDFPVNGSFVKPSGELQMEIINTKAALHERIFYPWMRECTNPWWAYADQPYTTAVVTVDFTKHNDVKYVFTGVRPKQITLLGGEQSGTDTSNLCRNVTFMYDFMFVTSDLTVMDSTISKLLGSAGALASGVGSMLNIGK